MTSEPSWLRWREGDENTRLICAFSGREVTAEGGAGWGGREGCKTII